MRPTGEEVCFDDITAPPKSDAPAQIENGSATQAPARIIWVDGGASPHARVPETTRLPPGREGPLKGNVPLAHEPAQPAQSRLQAGGAASRLNLLADVFVVVGFLLADGLATLSNGNGLPSLMLVTALLVSFWVIIGSALGYYDTSTTGRELRGDAAVVATMVLAMMFVAALFSFAVPHWTKLARALAFCWPAVMMTRIVFARLGSRLDIPIEQVLILGTGPLARITGEDLRRRRRQRVMGYLLLADERAPAFTPPVLGTWTELESTLRAKPVDEVYIASDGPNETLAVQHAISVCENLGVPFALPAYTFRMQRARPAFGKAVADGYLHYTVVDPQTFQRVVKRMFDVVAAGAALWLLAPLFLVVAVFIKATSRGPIFFKQVRCGLRGKRFEMLKFRSMVADAEERRKELEALNERSGPVFKLHKDPRVTRVGAVLRKYSLDELPQLINVLRGDMSIVGPRPPIPDEVAKYQLWQLRRLSVRPGLTCLWQVSPGRHQISFDEWMYLDLQYVDHWSLLHDLGIIARTFPIVFSGGGEPRRSSKPRHNNLQLSVR
jgi:exopolysaccharide biosynthesis polyprenyl glycosylphosphotransferase